MHERQIYRDLVENTGALSQCVSPAGNFLYTNRAWREVLGYSEDEIGALSLFDVIQEDYREHCRRLFQRLLAGEDAGAVQMAFRTKDGRRVPVQGSLTVRVEDGRPVYTRGIFIQASEIALRESEQRYHDVVQHISEAIFTDDEQGHLVFANQRFFDVFGISPENKDSIRLEDCIAPECRLKLRERRDRLMRGEEVREHFDCRGSRADGASVWLEIGMVAVRRDGRIAGTQSTIRDITAPRRMEEALHVLSLDLAQKTGTAFFEEVALQLSRLLETEIGFVGKLTNGKRRVRTLGLSIDGQTAAPFEYALARTPCEEVIGRKAATFADRVSELFPEHRRLKEMGIRGYAGVALLDHRGRPIGHAGVMSRHPLGRPEAIESLLGMFAVRVAAEMERQSAETRFQNLFDFSSDAIVLTNSRGIIVLANRQAEALFGYSAAELTGKPVEELMPAYRRGEHAEKREMFYVKPHTREMGRGSPNLEALRKDGTVIPVEIGLSVIQSDDGPLTAASVRDISERRQAEQALRENEERTRQIIETALDAVVSMDTTGRIVGWNRQAEAVFGWGAGEVMGRRLSETIIPSAQREAHEQGIRHYFQTGESRMLHRHMEVKAMRRDSVEIPVEIAITQFTINGQRQFSAFIRDIAGRKQMEANLIEKHKMESIGRLAGGVAHDFNNVLTVINGYTRLLLRKAAKDPQQALESILRAGDHAAALTRQLLAFSRQQVLQLKRLDLNQVVTDLQPMLERLVGEDVQVRAILGTSLGKIQADPDHLAQVIMNLAANARDAMPLGGKLLLETAAVDWNGSDVRKYPDARPGRYIRLSVSDTGVGMDAQTQREIFEPFFTTKKPGQGTGLGLSMVYGIVKQSGGQIAVYSEPGHGSTFKVYFPEAEKGKDMKTDAAALAETQAAPPLARSATVLVVEDQTDLREYVAAVLEDHGYRVFKADGAAAAIAICQSETGTSIDLVLTDVVMPDLSGRKLTDLLATERPGIKVLFMSGYTDNVVVHHGILDEGVNFIEKPFTAEALVEKIDAVLGFPPS